jgi:hypothetical protein
MSVSRILYLRMGLKKSAISNYFRPPYAHFKGRGPYRAI